MKMPSTPVIIGVGVTAVGLLILIATGVAADLVKGILALLGIGAAVKSAQIVSKARNAITDSTEANIATTDELNRRQEDRASADGAAVTEAGADGNPDTAVPPTEDEREKLRLKMEEAKWGRES